MKTLSTPAFWLALATGVVSFRFTGDENWSNLFLVLTFISCILASVSIQLSETMEFLQEEAEFDFEIEDHDDIDLTGLSE